MTKEIKKYSQRGKKSQKYLHFLVDYECYIKGVKYRITDETQERYIIKSGDSTNTFSKELEGVIYEVGNIKYPISLG